MVGEYTAITSIFVAMFHTETKYKKTWAPHCYICYIYHASKQNVVSDDFVHV